MSSSLPIAIGIVGDRRLTCPYRKGTCPNDVRRAFGLVRTLPEEPPRQMQNRWQTLKKLNENSINFVNNYNFQFKT
jgi:hypothetical protein